MEKRLLFEYATVNQIQIGLYEQAVGTAHNNPLMDTRKNEVQYASGNI